MFDKERKAHVTFNAPVLPVSLDPRTYEEHLEFATWYQVISSTRRTDRVRQLVRRELSRYSLMQLRAVFLFAVFERMEENEKRDMLNELERAQLWDRLVRRGLVTYCAAQPPQATGNDGGITYPNN